MLLIGLLDNYELYQEWTVIVHHRGYFRICSSCCKSVQNRSNRTHTQPGTRGARRLAPLATPHTLYASKRIEAYGITLFLGLNDPRASRVRVPHAPAVSQHRNTPCSLFSSADRRLVHKYTCDFICLHEPHSSPFLKPTEAP
jgi:hypothetical protein